MTEQIHNTFESEKFQNDSPKVDAIMKKHLNIIEKLPFKSTDKKEEFFNLIAKIIIQSSTIEVLEDLQKDIAQKFYAPREYDIISHDPIFNIGIIRNDKWANTTIMTVDLLESFFDIRYREWKSDEDIIYLRQKVAQFMSAVYRDYRLQEQK